MARLILSSNGGTETVMKSGLGMTCLAVAALASAALVFPADEAFAKKPIGTIIKNGINSIDDAVSGFGKGTRALDDLGEGVGRNLDDLGQGVGRNADDAGQAGATGFNRPLPPILDDADEVVDVPRYTAAPLKPAEPQGNIYDVIRPDQFLPDDAGTQGFKAHAYGDLQKKAAGYLQPDDLLEPDDVIDVLDAPGGYIKPGKPAEAPLKPDLKGGTPVKPEKGGKVKLDKAKVAEIAPLAKQGGNARKGVHVVRVPLARMPPPQMSAEAARALAKKVRRIKIAGSVTAVLVAGTTTTVILYYTVEPVREFFDGTGEAVKEGFGDVSDFFTPDVKLTVDNQADGPVEIFRTDANGNLESIGSINETPGSTTVDVQQGDTITVFLSGAPFGDPFKVDEEKTFTVQ
ncbi:MAG: hypothetical protein AB7S80_16380 [Rhizobiaceae bacterium]